MELPRHTGDAVPESVPGAVLALADRFDLLMAMFSLGAKPTGSSDPFGLRRAALGIVRITRDVPALAGVTVDGGLQSAATHLREQGLEVSDAAIEAAREFVVGRFAQQLRDEGVPVDFVNAILPGASSPGTVTSTLSELRERADEPTFRGLVAAVQRIARIVPAGTPATYDEDLLTEPAEKRLVDAVRAMGDCARCGVAEFAVAGAGIVDAVNAFFDDILVMADDPALRAARLGLLASISARTPRSVDWQALDVALG
jgi:glycyl-tRNA synthetase